MYIFTAITDLKVGSYREALMKEINSTYLVVHSAVKDWGWKIVEVDLDFD